MNATEAEAGPWCAEHAAHHEAMECLGEMIWASQRIRLPPNGPAYIDAVHSRATR